MADAGVSLVWLDHGPRRDVATAWRCLHVWAGVIRAHLWADLYVDPHWVRAWSCNCWRRIGGGWWIQRCMDRCRHKPGARNWGAAMGIECEYTGSISLVAAISLLVSWAVALTALTLLCMWLLKPGEAVDEEKAYDRAYLNAYRRAMGFLIRWRWITAGPLSQQSFRV